jgi:hypothetical protein
LDNIITGADGSDRTIETRPIAGPGAGVGVAGIRRFSVGIDATRRFGVVPPEEPEEGS